MKKEGTLGAATLLAIAAVVGFSVQTGQKSAEGGRPDASAATKKSVIKKQKAPKAGPGCGSLLDELQVFVQNILGRLRTMAMTIVILFLATTIATSTYPFDPRQGLSAVLIVLFVIAGVVIVKVYAEMHRDATLSHVTNTTPGELGTEFWFKLIGFGFAPMVTLLTRVFPGITDFVFSWLQPGVASLK